MANSGVDWQARSEVVRLKGAFGPIGGMTVEREIMGDIVDRIRADHTMMVRLLGRLETLVGSFTQGGEPDLHLMGEMIDFLVTYPDMCHHPMEDLLYDALERKAPQAAASIADMRREHEAMAGQLRNLAQAMSSILMEVEVSRETFSAMVRNFMARQLHHLTNEETGLLKMARDVLDAEDLQRLGDEAREKISNFGECRQMVRHAHFLPEAEAAER